MPRSTAIFFDLGDTLVIPRTAPDGKLVALDVLPFVVEVLNRLLTPTEIDVVPPKLGLMSNTPADATRASMRVLLDAAALLPCFDSSLLLYSSVEGLSKSDPKFFRRGAQRASIPPSQCIFVGEDEAERGLAQQVGFKVSFHPLHVFHVLGRML